MRKLAPFFATLLLLVITSLAQAQDTFPLNHLDLTDGSVTFTGTTSSPTGRFTFTGPEISLTGGLSEGVLGPACEPCAGGQQVSIRTSFAGDQSIRPGTLTVGGTSRDVYYAGNLVFDGAPVRLPMRYTRMPFNVSFPITLEGNLRVHRLNPFNNGAGLLFELPVRQQGTATLTLSLWFINPNTGQPLYRFRGLTYKLAAVKDDRDDPAASAAR
jgi:hypothetical protein